MKPLAKVQVRVCTNTSKARRLQ